MADVLLMDLDGTLCDGAAGLHLGDHDYHHYATTDAPARPEMLAVIRDAAGRGIETVVVTGRYARWQPAAELWLWRVRVHPLEFHSRSDSDWRPNRVVKSEILADIRTRHNVVAAYDDDPRNLEVFRAAGIPLVVAVGEFDRRLA